MPIGYKALLPIGYKAFTFYYSEIVLVVVQDEASFYYKEDMLIALKAIGSSLDSWIKFREPYALVGKKSSPRPSWVRDKRHGRFESPVVIDAEVPYNASLVAPLQTIGTPRKYVFFCHPFEYKI